jgi:hypothetical protein
MKIEIVNYYPRWWDKEKMHSEGSLHIYVEDWKLDIRGIMVKWNGSSAYVRMPQMTSYDYEQKRKIAFPIVGFTDNNAMRSFIELIRQELKPYLEKYAPESCIPRALVKKPQFKKKAPSNFSEKKPPFKDFKCYTSAKDRPQQT